MMPSFVLLAYFGPETVLPVTSIIATVIGVVMMLGRSSLTWFFGCFKSAVGFCLRRGSSPGSRPALTTPHRKKEGVKVH